MGKRLADLGGTAGAVVAGGAVVVALALGAYIGFGREQAVTPMTSQAAPAQQTARTPEQAQTQAPALDELRRESDGTTIIAGRAAPLSEVRIMLDGVQVGDAVADSTGGFAAIAMLPPKQTAQVLTLEPAAGGALPAEEIILAPMQAAPASDVAEAGGAVAADQTAATAEAPAVVVLKSDADGVRLLNPAVPEAMTSVALDTIGYSALGDVQLTGRAQPDTAKVRVYLDNRSIITLPVGADGRWNGDLPDVDEGIYTLRVDELSAAGTVSSRVETPFKRESGAVLAQVAQGSDGSVKSITVQTGATLWAIARERYGDGTLYLRVFEANAASIRNPDLIYPGQIFDLPD